MINLPAALLLVAAQFAAAQTVAPMDAAPADPVSLHRGFRVAPNGDVAVFSIADWEPLRASLGLAPTVTANFADEWLQLSTRDGKFEVFRVERQSARRRRAWEWTATFGPARTDYFPTTIRLKAAGVDATLTDIKPQERETMAYWNPTYGENPFQAIDEPTNALYVRAENPEQGLALVFSYFHPKLSMVGNSPHMVNAAGIIDGQPVDGQINLNDHFHSYRLTKGFVRFGAGVEKFWRTNSGRMGTLTYGVGITPQFYMGYAMVELKSAEPDSAPEGKMRPIGAGVGVTQRISYEFPKSRFSVTATHGLDAARLKYKFLDGTATHDLAYSTFHAGLGYRIAPKKRPRKTIPGL